MPQAMFVTTLFFIVDGLIRCRARLISSIIASYSYPKTKVYNADSSWRTRPL